MLIVIGQVLDDTALADTTGRPAQSRLTLHVNRSSNTAAPAGSRITVYRDGALTPSTETDPGGVDYRVEGAPNSQPGDQVLAFLHHDPNPDRPQAWTPVSSIHGLWLHQPATGRYTRLGRLPDGFQTSVDSATAAALAGPR